MAEPSISAIVCVHNREDTLADCLSALERQSLTAPDLEVVIVDNASTDGSTDIARGFAQRLPHFRYVREDRVGLSVARNRGMREAQSDIAAFTDDDAIPDRDWARLLLHRFETLDPSTVSVGGEIDPIWGATRPGWLEGDTLLHALSVCLGWSDYAHYLAKSEWLCEVNSAYRISTVTSFGGFPENLGRIGTNLLSGENAVNAVLARNGHRFFFDPEIRVRHQIPPARMERPWFRRRFFWQGATTFLVRKYLQDQGCEAENASIVRLPMNEAGWVRLFSHGTASDFEQSLNELYGLGYTLAATNVLGGR